MNDYYSSPTHTAKGIHTEGSHVSFLVWENHCSIMSQVKFQHGLKVGLCWKVGVCQYVYEIFKFHQILILALCTENLFYNENICQPRKCYNF